MQFKTYLLMFIRLKNKNLIYLIDETNNINKGIVFWTFIFDALRFSLVVLCS